MYLAGILGLCVLLAVPFQGLGKHMSAQEPAKAGAEQDSEPGQASQPTPQEAPKPNASQPSGQTSGSQKPEASRQSEPASTPSPEQTTVPKKKNPSDKASKSPHKKAKSQSQSPSPEEGTKKTVVRHGSTSEPTTQLSPEVSQQQAAQQRQRIQQALAVTDANLEQLSGVRLPAEKQRTVDQIRKFMEQSREASKSGDLQRAENLAQKAQLLSNDLVKK